MTAMPEITTETMFDANEISSDTAATLSVTRAMFKRAYTTDDPPVNSGRVHDRLCLPPSMFFLSALQFLGAMEFEFTHGEDEVLTVHLDEGASREEQVAWVEEIETVARATFAAHDAEAEREWHYAAPQFLTQRVGHLELSFVQWTFRVY